MCDAAGTGRVQAVHRSRVEWMDTDAAGHHHNTAIVRFVEAAEAALVARCGLDGYFGAAPRVRFEADYTARLWFGQQVTAVVFVERVGTSSLTLGFEVWGEPTGDHPRALAAKGRYVTVYLPPGHESSVPWPAAWRAALRGAAPRRASSVDDA
ncbi:acyl-CoA thioesterase [Streptomyces odontomachi]|uniref:acyl-CoA thioesterase n=1 Tax=Streptomyces odontomachi TaxID=2944940 RepID=UPI00210972D8|nr:hotdog domain-containing protein [Streptomyces sp. ODS25]